MKELTKEDWARIDAKLEEYGKELKEEANRLRPYTEVLRKRLKSEFPLNVTKDDFSNAVCLDFGHGYDITVYVNEKQPLEYSWNIGEQDLMNDGFIGSVKNKYYTIDEVIKFLNSIKDWL